MLADRIILAAGGGRLDRYTKSLLHFNGADGSTNFKDETGRIWTKYSHGLNNARISTATSKFGGASGIFDDNAYNFISTPYSSDFALGAEDFTIDFWIRFRSTPYGGGVLTFKNDSTGEYSYGITVGYDDESNKTSFNFEHREVGSDNYYYGPTFILYSGAFPLDSWRHIELARNGSRLYGFLNGVKQSEQTISFTVRPVSGAKLFLGSNPLISGNNMYIDEFRFSKGIARHTSNFTPPTEEY